MAGVVTRVACRCGSSRTRAFGNRAYCTLNEGLGKVLRYGAFSRRGARRACAGSRPTLAPVMKQALALARPARHEAASSPRRCRWATRGTTATAPAPRCSSASSRRTWCGSASRRRDDRAGPRRSCTRNDHFFLNLSMPACKCTLDAAEGIAGSSIDHRRWRATAPTSASGSRRSATAGSPGRRRMVEGLYLPGFGAAGRRARTSATRSSPRPRASAASPWPPRPRSCSSSAAAPEDALATTRRMYEITLARERRLPDPGARLPRHADRHRPPQGRRDRHPARHQHRHRPQGARRRHGGRRAGEAAARMFQGRTGRLRGGLLQSAGPQEESHEDHRSDRSRSASARRPGRPTSRCR